MGEAVRGLAGKRSAVLLANHGPVVAGSDLVLGTERIELDLLHEDGRPVREGTVKPPPSMC